MRYTIKVEQEDDIEPYTSPGMAAFTLFSFDEQFPDQEGWSGMFAPRELLNAQSGDSIASLRLAGFIVHEVWNTGENDDEPDEAELFFQDTIKDICKYSSQDGPPPVHFLLSTQQDPALRVLLWPSGMSFDELLRFHQADLSRSALWRWPSLAPLHPPWKRKGQPPPALPEFDPGPVLGRWGAPTRVWLGSQCFAVLVFPARSAP